MTMPHLMNCPHSPNGWCLKCVAQMHARFVSVREYVAYEKREYEANAERCSKMHNNFGASLDTSGSLACKRILDFIDKGES
jgi:hypothetical protein